MVSNLTNRKKMIEKDKVIKTSVAACNSRQQPGVGLFQVPAVAALINDPARKRLTKMVTRSTAATIMFLVAYLVFSMGHVFVACVALALQFSVFQEMLAVRYCLREEKTIPYFRTTCMLWFFVACFYSYGTTWLRAPLGGIDILKKSVPFMEGFIAIEQFHEFISFCLYCMIFVLTVLQFQEGKFEYQMTQLAWTFLTIAVVILQSKSCIVNIYNGMFWVAFPGLLVITNDVMAYFVGKALGKKMYNGPFLPHLSPNKTWEGFIGGGIFTMIFGWYGPIMLSYPSLICTYEQIKLHGGCEPSNVFTPQDLRVWPFSQFLDENSVPIIHVMPVQVHGLFLAAFASMIVYFQH